MAEPKIRFKGYNDEWVVSSYCEIAKSFKYGLNACAISFDGMNKYLRITDIDDETRCFIQSQLTTPGIDLSFADEYLLQDGDITFARTGASVGKSYIYHKYDGKAYFAGFLIRMQTIDSVSPDFIFQNSLTSRFLNHIKIVSQRSGQPGINTNELKAYELLIPDSLAEQQQIASCFKSLDTLIQSTKKKIASLKQLKSASLISMFPQAGETKPRVRFKGFKGDWEKKKLLDIASFSKGRGYSKSDIVENGTPLVLYGRLYTKYELSINNVDTYAYLKQGSVLSEGNEIIIPASGETAEDIAVASVVRQKNVILGGDLNIVKLLKDVPEFCALEITYGNAHNELVRVAQGKTVVHLHNSEICKKEIALPSLAEQKKIASFFCSLDARISLETQRLNKLKQIKSACLDKMFV